MHAPFSCFCLLFKVKIMWYNVSSVNGEGVCEANAFCKYR